MARAIEDSNRRTADDKRGGFHEEGGVAGTDASGQWVVSRDKPGPSGNPDVDKDLPMKKAPADNKADSIIDLRVFFHVHPNGRTAAGNSWTQPPSEVDKGVAADVEKAAAAAGGQTGASAPPINIVIGNRRTKGLCLQRLWCYWDHEFQGLP